MTEAACEPFVIERSFNAPRERVWEVWTRPEHLANWFGPKGSQSEIVEYDLRPGGLWRGWMALEDGTRLFSRFRFREIVPPERLVWEHSFGDEAGGIARAPFSETWPLVMLTTVLFEDQGDTTRITLSWIPLDATDAEIATFDEAKPGMTGGWTGTFEQLDDYLANG